MPFNVYSVGRDILVDIVGGDGSVLRLDTIVSFKSQQETHQAKVPLLSGEVDFLELPAGWKGTIEVERSDDTLSSFFADQEDAYYSGQDIGYGTIIETITNPDGSGSQYQYDKCVFKLTDAGHWKGDSTVKQSMEFMCSKRLKIG